MNFGLRNIVCLAIVAFAVASCSSSKSNSSSESELKVFQVRGVIKTLEPDGKTAVIQHEAIPGYMAAMTMPLSVKNTNDLAGVKVGDTVTFRLLVNSTDGWIDQVKTVASGTPPVESKPSSVRIVRNVDPLTVGDSIPNYKFTNELGKALSLADFKGEAVALTFIFTRCPFPLFCPRMTSNFSAIYKKLSDDPAAPKNWHLLTISFDPEYDTPSVLLRYAKNQNYDPKKWSFVTGAQIDIDAIAEQFGLVFVKSDTGFDHKLRTVIITPEGKVHKIIPANDWNVDEVAAELKSVAQAAKSTK